MMKKLVSVIGALIVSGGLVACAPTESVESTSDSVVLNADDNRDVDEPREIELGGRVLDVYLLDSDVKNDGYVYEYVLELHDGVQVRCVDFVHVWNRIGAGAGGNSCDWAGLAAKQVRPEGETVEGAPVTVTETSTVNNPEPGRE